LAYPFEPFGGVENRKADTNNQVMRRIVVFVNTAGEKHWHGATPTAAMTHIAIQEKLNT